MRVTLSPRRADQIFRAAAVCAWVTLTVLSLLPGQDRPHTGFSGNVEHLMAYLLAALVTRMGFRSTASRKQLLAFSIAAAAFELGQIWIPGRSAGVDNWASSSVGALVGIGLGRWLAHRAEASRRRSASASPPP